MNGLRTLIAAAICMLLASAAAATAAGQAVRPAVVQKIAFASNRTGQNEIVVANVDGTGRVDLNAQGSSPELSPDGRRIAFTSARDGNSEIYVMNADGTNQTRLTVNTLYDSRPHWTADGRKLVFTRVTADGNWEIFRMNADGSNQVDLTNNPAVEWGQSTRADTIVFTREENGVGHIFSMNVDGRDVRQLTDTSFYDSYPNQSSRANRILFLRDTADHTGDDIWIMGVNGGAAVQLTHQSATGAILEPTWSPDGSQIMYSQCGPSGATPCALHVMNADGTGDHDVSTPSAPLTETFENGVTDGGLWHTISDPGGSLTTSGGKLVASISGSAVPGGQYDQVDEHIGSQCTLTGDFDYQVDYTLLTWPDFGGVFAQLTAFFADGGVSRSSQTWSAPYNQQYGMNAGGSFGTLLTTDTSGTLRLVRVGGTLSAYVRSSSLPNWTLVGSGPALNPGVVGMGLWAPGNQFQHEDASVAYDDFRLNSGALACPTWWSDNSADWAPPH